METDNSRHFFRATGIVYLAVDDLHKSNDQKHEAPDSLDSIRSLINQTQSKLALLNVQNKELFEDLIKLILELYTSTKQSLELNESKFLTRFSAHRYSVIISGDTLEYISQAPLEIGIQKQLTIVMVDYPFETVTTKGTVIKCEQLKHSDSPYKLVFKFDEISQYKEDILVKFVNSLQRRKIANEKDRKSKST